MITRVVMAALLLLATGAAQTMGAADSANRNKVEPEVRALLNAQVAAWNRGDIEGFMAGYWHSPELTFFSNTTETKGWESTLQRYKQRYQGEHRSMGKLTFSDLEVTPLSIDAAFVRGAWHLSMPDGKEPHGIYTLVLRKFPEGWKVVHDHTSGE